MDLDIITRRMLSVSPNDCNSQYRWIESISQIFKMQIYRWNDNVSTSLNHYRFHSLISYFADIGPFLERLVRPCLTLTARLLALVPPWLRDQDKQHENPSKQARQRQNER